MLGFGMSELIMVAVIICVVIFGLLIKGKGSSSFVNILTVLIGVGIIVFASMCFTDVPFVGTIFVLPGDNIMNAQMVSPALRIVAFFLGGAFAIMGVFFQFKIGCDRSAKESVVNTIVSENREGKTYCHNCGTQLQDANIRFCSSCGSQVVRSNPQGTL